MSTTTSNLGLFKYTEADHDLPFNYQEALNDNWDILDEALLRSTKNIGEIIQSTIPLVDSGLHLLDGGILYGDGIYADFVEYIAGLVTDYPNLFTTEANWEQSVTDYGVCGKFVYDSENNTVRLPNITGFIEGVSGVANLGDLTQAGLPNITGGLDKTAHSPGSCYFNTAGGVGAITNTRTSDIIGQVSTVSTSTGTSGFDFDASLSNPIYGNSTTVQPQSVKVLYYIVVATTTKTDIQVDIDEIATDLNNKVDISNLQTVYCVTETYTNGSSWYRVYSDGWCEQGGETTAAVNGVITVTFLKPYTNRPNVSITRNFTVDASNNDAAYQVRTAVIYSVQNNSFICWDNGWGTSTVMWTACGYIL